MVPRWFALFILTVASLVATTTVHARELPGVMALKCSGAVHAEPDNGSKPPSGEADKGLVEHSGCHSASTFIAGSTAAGVIFAHPSRSYPVLHVAALLPHQFGPGLRPPIA